MNWKDEWPEGTEEIEYKSTLDFTTQKMLAYSSKDNTMKPLLVALHTWSYGYDSAGNETIYAKWCVENNWVMIHPDFRGMNNTPKAMGSKWAVQDIADAVEYIREREKIDSDRIYLVGASGGGHMAMLAAGKLPHIWAGVSAWVGIYDILQWWKDTNSAGLGYSTMIEQSIGGSPEKDITLQKECLERSPACCFYKAKGLNIDINAGVNDGRSGSVPFYHSLQAFNAVADDMDKIPGDVIREFYKTQSAPLSDCGLADNFYGKKQPVYRKISGNSRVTIFNGGHEIIYNAALNWLAAQRKGTSAVWDIKCCYRIQEDDVDSNVKK